MTEKNYLTNENISAKTSDWLDIVKHNNRTDIEFFPYKSALIVIDMQKYFFEENFKGFTPAANYIKGNVIRLIDYFRNNQMPVIFTKNINKKDGSDLGILNLWWEKMIEEDSYESELIDELIPNSYELVINKNRFSAFYNTQLDKYLLNNQIEQVVVAGVMTNVCVESTVRDAFFRDFIPFLPADATAAKRETFHTSSLRNVAYCCGIITKTDSIISK